MRTRHYSPSTEKADRHWIIDFLRVHRRGQQWRHPAELGKPEIEAFLAHLARARNVAVRAAASTSGRVAVGSDFELFFSHPLEKKPLVV